MSGKEPHRNRSSRPLAATAIVIALVLSTAPVRADGLWDNVLETLNLKASPAGPAPSFVEKTRPDPEGLNYIPSATPHKVSPLAVKTPAEIQAKKDALDAAKARQSNPTAPAPLQVAKGRKPAAVKPAPAVAE